MKCEHGIYIGASDKIAIYCPLCNPSGPDSLKTEKSKKSHKKKDVNDSQQ
jgi:hypothetical protein